MRPKSSSSRDFSITNRNESDQITIRQPGVTLYMKGQMINVFAQNTKLGDLAHKIRAR